MRSSRVSFWIWAGFLAIPQAHGQVLLKDICGPEGSTLGPGALQAEQQCRAAYVNGNGYVINDNNSRVRASVAIVNAYKCVTGFSGCAAAVENGRKSVDYSHASDDHYTSAQSNGKDAFQLRGGQMFSNEGTDSKGTRPRGSEGAPSLPESCRQAQETGNVQDRFNCALATDSGVSAETIKNPQFLKDFETATGQSLQNMINRSAESLVQDYARGAFEHAFAQSKLSMADFAKRGTGLLGEMLNSFGTDRGRETFLSGVLPDFLKGNLPNSPNSKIASVSKEARSVPEAETGMPRDSAAEPSGAALQQNSGSALYSGATRSALSPEENPAISIFERVTHAYQRQFYRGNVGGLEALLPGNRLQGSEN